LSRPLVHAFDATAFHTDAKRYVSYRPGLKPRARSLRGDPTRAERKIWFEFLRTLPHKFTRQKPLGRYIADFYCSSHRLIVEIDGDSHYTERGEGYDHERTAALSLEGIRVVRFANTDVMQNFEAVCMRILCELNAKT
jgi:very-short-patch-repair endonuclease